MQDMNNKTKAERFFMLLLLCVGFLALLCLVGCSGSCMGYKFGCDNNDGGCAAGCGSVSEGCTSDDSCYSTLSCVDYTRPYTDGSGKVLLVSCDSSEDGCGGEENCYNGFYCGGCSSCGNCGVFCGSEGDFELDETTVGCFDGCVLCGGTEGIWKHLLENIYIVTGLK